MGSASRVLVISGMHRSGTSLLAALAAAADVDMGGEMVSGGRGNRRGHFEDAEFVRFHEGCLERRGAGPLAPPCEGVPEVSAAEEGAAWELVARRAGKAAWGFKDPRTALFLPLWERLLAGSCFLFLYRHPAEVALSLLRRGIDLEVQLDPATAVRAWRIYNRRILAFRERCPERCLLLSIAAVRRDLPAALALAAARSGLPLARATGETIFAPDELRTGLAASDVDWCSAMPEAMEIYRQLEAAADLPAVVPDGGDREVEIQPSATPRERESQEASEHLLAAALTARTGAPPTAVPLDARRTFSELKLELARRDDHLRDLRARIDRLTGRVEELGGEHRQLVARLGEIESTRAMRLVRAYWGTARRLRGWRRQTAWDLRRAAGGHRPPPAAEIVVGCVAENDPRFLAQALLLARSLRWFGGSLAASRLLVCVVAGGTDSIDAAARARLASAGAEVRAVAPFDRRNPQANKLQFFAEALDGKDGAAARGLLLLDCDTAVVRDPLPLLAGGALQAKIADVPSVTHETFERLFGHYGLPLPRRRYRTTLLPEATILYCNSGVVFLTADVARELVPAWRAWNRRLLDARELLGSAGHHANQASLTLALAEHPVPFAEATAALNFPLHMGHLERPAEVLAIDPAILHYHEAIDERGLLRPTGAPRAQARIEALNRRLSEEMAERAADRRQT